jgi:NAD-dependent deacetylase
MKTGGHILILTGAGISAESGLGTFREQGGLWTQYDLNEVATPEGFARNPGFVQEFYNARRANSQGAQPHAAHRALARLQHNWAGRVTLVTQNVDDLHERGGAREVVHMHGELNRALCAVCGHRWEAPAVMHSGDLCPACGKPATRPDVVWFGEMPYHLERIYQELARTDLFVAIGTSGNVYPAAGFVSEARAAGACTLELNLEPSATIGAFEDARFGPASRVVPDWVEEMLAG